MKKTQDEIFTEIAEGIDGQSEQIQKFMLWYLLKIYERSLIEEASKHAHEPEDAVELAVQVMLTRHIQVIDEIMDVLMLEIF